MTSLSGPDDDLVKGGFLERQLTRLLMRPAQVSTVTRLTDHFVQLNLTGPALAGATWAPGDKVQIKFPGGLVSRTYTPVWWDPVKGAVCIVGYLHAGTGLAGEWLRKVRPGERRHLFGPRRSINLDDIGTSALLFGDETSFALAAALLHGPVGVSGHRFLFEVDDPAESATVLAMLGISEPLLIRREGQDGHYARLCDAAGSLAPDVSRFILTGKAPSIQQVNRTLRAAGVPSSHIRAKAYWAPGKIGLD